MSNLKQRDFQSVWHPFTQMKGADIIPIVKGEGAYLYDEDNNKYIDAVSSWWTCTHGHSHPYISKKIAEQAQQLSHVAFGGFTHPQAVLACERIIKLLPDSITKIFFSDNGSTANEVALKMSIQYWHNKDLKKTKFIAFEGAYHGDTFGSMSVAPRKLFNIPFEDNLFEVSFIPTPNQENINDLIAQINELNKNNDVAAFIFEPIIQGVRGMYVYEPELLDQLIVHCQNKNILCIADEVMTGFGRTGKMFAHNHLNKTADIIALSKGMTGGFFASGATAVSQEIYDAFYSDNGTDTFLHGHSFTGNPIMCAAINANLDLFEKEKIWNNISQICEIQKSFSNLIGSHKNVNLVHQFGTILSIELKTNASTSYFNKKGKNAYQWFLEKGVIMRPLGNILVLVPPFCIQEKELINIHQLIQEYLELD